MQYIKFFNPNGFARDIQDHDNVDTSRIVTHPVRRYFHGNHVQYTVLACADYRTPYKIFYDLEISRPHDIEFPTNSYKDIRIFKQLTAEYPIPEQAYIKGENKLRKKIDEKRLQLFQEKRMELMEKLRMEIMVKTQETLLTVKANEYVALDAKSNAEPSNTNISGFQAVVVDMKTADNEVKNKIDFENVADDLYDGDDDDYSGGVLGIYARSD